MYFDYHIFLDHSSIRMHYIIIKNYICTHFNIFLMGVVFIKTIHKKHGFTLVELIVVLSILAILATLLIPSLTGYIEKAKNRLF